MLRKWIGATVPLAMSYAYVTHERRPFSPLADPNLYPHNDHELLSPSDRTQPISEIFRSFRQDSISSNLMRSFTLSAITGLCRFYLSSCDVNIQGLDQFHAILQQSWPTLQEDSKTTTTSRPVLTVSNHMSTLDDPIILSRIAPMSCLSNVERHRWGGCSEEICFASKTAASFFGSGKILPIWRGGGLKQEMFQELAMHLRPGSWVHVFPEGCICQNHFNRSSTASRRREYMRWGVGKMIAKAKIRPVIVPFYHDGMDLALPLEDGSGTMIRAIPKLGVKVNVIFGTPINVDDLLDAYETKHGRDELDNKEWNVKENEDTLQLYKEITKRIQMKMEELDPRPLYRYT